MVFIDEAHELDKSLQTALYLALDQRRVLLQGSRKGSTPVAIPIKDFTLLLASTDEFQLLQPLRDRMRLTLRFQFYAPGRPGQDRPHEGGVSRLGSRAGRVSADRPAEPGNASACVAIAPGRSPSRTGRGLPMSSPWPTWNVPAPWKASTTWAWGRPSSSTSDTARRPDPAEHAGKPPGAALPNRGRSHGAVPDSCWPRREGRPGRRQLTAEGREHAGE